MSTASLPRGLYAITPDWTDTDRLLTAVEQVLAAGAVVLQYRNKLADAGLRLQQALALQARCRHHHVPLIINDHLELALAIDADGLHLGGDDGELAAARRALGPQRLLGASCYNQLALAQSAQAAGASYVALGAAYVSATKPLAVQAPLALYKAACAQLDCPVVAIGGITPLNASPLLAAGVTSLAVIGGLYEGGRPAERAAAYAALFEDS